MSYESVTRDLASSVQPAARPVSMSRLNGLRTLLILLAVAMMVAAASTPAEAKGSGSVRRQAHQVHVSAVRLANATRADYKRAHQLALSSVKYARRAQHSGSGRVLRRAKVSLTEARKSYATERRRAPVVTKPASKASPTVPIGISYGDTLTWMTDRELGAALDDAVALGVTTIRADISWQTLMPDTPRTTLWGRSDRVIDAARARGLNVLGVIAYTPAWARASDCTAANDKCPPADPVQFAQFAGRVAARYALKGVSFEIWNEMNWPQFWVKPNPEEYGALLRASITRIRRADPSATILMGGLVPTSGGSGAINHSEFLRRACANGRCRGLSGVAFHPYNYPVLASAATTWHTPWERMTKDSSGELALKSAMARAGLGDLKVWVTEFGAPTRGSSGAADGSAVTAPGTDHVTESFQARILTDGIATAVRQRETVGGLWLYTNRDSVEGSWYNSYGLRRIDGTPKPAFAAVRSAIRALP